MIITLTNSEDSTANYLTPKLLDADIRLLRLDTDLLVSKLELEFQVGRPSLTYEGSKYSPEEISHVWYRRPERLKNERFEGKPEGKFSINEWSEAVEGFLSHIPFSRWMNHPSSNAAASNKLEQLSVAQSFGLSVPDTLLTQDSCKAISFFERHAGRIITKPLSNGYVERTGIDDTIIYTNKVEREHIETAGGINSCPTLFQELIEKESDVRITVVDNDLHAVKLHATDDDGKQRCDIRRNNMTDVAYEPITLPVEISRRLRRLVSYYQLRFGAIDMAIDSNKNWIFFEINANGQWAWLDLTAGQNIADSFIKSFSHVSIKNT